MVEITLPIVLQIIQTVGILVGIVYYITIMRNSQRMQKIQLETRQMQMFMQIYYRMDDVTAKAHYTLMSWEWSDFDEFMERYGEFKNPEVWSANASRVATYLNGVEILVRNGFINPTLVDDILGRAAVELWEKMAPIIREYRVRYSATKWEAIEYLYNILKPLRDKRLEKILSPNL
jgi:hypothetical protein